MEYWLPGLPSPKMSFT